MNKVQLETTALYSETGEEIIVNASEVKEFLAKGFSKKKSKGKITEPLEPQANKPEGEK